jgi:hypothetical protein
MVTDKPAEGEPHRFSLWTGLTSKSIPASVSVAIIHAQASPSNPGKSTPMATHAYSNRPARNTDTDASRIRLCSRTAAQIRDLMTAPIIPNPKTRKRVPPITA